MREIALIFLSDYGNIGISRDLFLLHFYFFSIATTFIIIFDVSKNSILGNPISIKLKHKVSRSTCKRLSYQFNKNLNTNS